MAEAFCRKGLHLIENRAVHADGRTYCVDCRIESRRAKRALKPGGRDAWADPVADREAGLRARRRDRVAGTGEAAGGRA